MLGRGFVEEQKSTFWWRSVEEFDESGHLKEPERPSELTPRLRLLRELERLARVAPEAIDDLRHKLFSYKPGDLYLPTGGITKEEMEIPPLVTLLLLGFKGAGKGALINLMYTVLGRAGLIPFARTSRDSSSYRTYLLEEHNVLRSTKSGFCVFDSRSLDYDHLCEGLDDVWSWMMDGVRHLQECWRPSDGASRKEESEGRSFLNKFVKRRVNCAIVLASLTEIHQALKAGDNKSLEATRELFCFPAIRKCNENPLLILTHGDLLGTEERLESRLEICKFLGISETSGAYDIACLTDQGLVADESDPITAYALAEAVYRALLLTDRSHLLKKTFMDWFLQCIYWFMGSMAVVFTVLANWFSKCADKVENKLKLN